MSGAWAMAWQKSLKRLMTITGVPVEILAGVA